MQDQRDRNRGIVPVAVAPAIAGTTVAVAGVGGVGASIIEPFVRQCRIRRVKVADPDRYDMTNLNRQVGASHETLALSKAKVVAGLLRQIDPELVVEEYAEGVTLDNADSFLGGADVLVDAVDFKRPDIHLALVRRARQLAIPVIIGIEICYGARAVWFAPTGMTFERFFRLTEDQEALDLRRMIMRLPDYLDPRVLTAVKTGEIEAPTIATGGANISALLVPMLEAILSGVDTPPPAPVFYFTDTKAGSPRSGRIRYHQLAWWMSVARVGIRNRLHRNQRAL